MTVGEDAWVMPHGVLASIPPRRTGLLFGCPRRIPSRGGASAEFVDVVTWKVRWLQFDGRCFLCKFIVDLFGLLMNSWRAHFSYVLKTFTSTSAVFTVSFFGLFLYTRAGGRVRVVMNHHAKRISDLRAGSIRRRVVGAGRRCHWYTPRPLR